MRTRELLNLIKRRSRRNHHSVSGFKNNVRRGGLVFGSAFGFVFVFCVLAFGLFYARQMEGLPSIDQLPLWLDTHNGLLLQPTRFYDRSGQKLMFTLENEQVERRFLKANLADPEHFSPHFMDATVAVDDPSFWQHPGFTLKSLTSDEPVTIAEKLADKLLLWKEPQSLRRRFFLRLLAVQMTARYGREQVLEWYLNSVYYGHLAYGADVAARLYFGKPAGQLTLAESALLIAASKTPVLNPIDSPTAAQEKQKEILKQLVEMKIISAQDYEQANQQTLTLATIKNDIPPPAYMKLVLDQLAQYMDNQRIEMGGLRVVTTLDFDLQQQTECTLRLQLNRLRRREESEGGELCEAGKLLPTMPPGDQGLMVDLISSAVVMDPQTGEVLAVTGKILNQDIGIPKTSYQPGSLLTPFIAVAGFSRGYSPASLVWDIPGNIPANLKGKNNPDGKYHGPLRLRQAIANDYVLPLVRLLVQFGTADVWRLVQPFGLTNIDRDSSANTLFEGGDTSPLEIAQAYSVFASEGIQHGVKTNNSSILQPQVLLSVEDLAGRRMPIPMQPDTQTVLSPQIAYLVHHILSDNMARRPSLGYPNPLDIGRPSGAKVGQTIDARQVWTVGYTPQRVVVVWIGQPDNRGLSGSARARLDVKWAAGLWHALMQYTSKTIDPKDWLMPPGINVVDICDPSGQLPTRDCPSVLRELFLQGNEPQSYDTLYRVSQINRETGLLATVFTPPDLVEEHTYMIIPLEAENWAREAGLSLLPTSYDLIQQASVSPDVRLTEPGLFSYVKGELQLRGTAAGLGFVSYRAQVGPGLNPMRWQQIGEERPVPVINDTLATWDTRQLEDGLYAIKLIVQRSDQKIETAVTQVTVDNTPPQASVPYPVDQQKIEASTTQTLNLQADVSDKMGVSRVMWIIDGREAGQRPQSPFVLSWRPSLGEHTLMIKVYDLAGNTGQTDTITFTILKKETFP